MAAGTWAGTGMMTSPIVLANLPALLLDELIHA